MAKKIYTLDDIVGHQGIISYFRRCKEKDTYQNVMIFHGNSGLGKTATAKLVALDIVSQRLTMAARDSIAATVIGESKNTDSIKLFNMSNLRDESAIAEVKAEMTVTFTSGGRKVLILDEAHGMSNEAQDSILVELEKLPDGVFIIFCTTELGVLRDAILSRAKCNILFRDLAAGDIKRLISNEIVTRRLTFQMPQSTIVAILAQWSGSQPRKAYNLLENFDEGKMVTNEEISLFIDIDASSEVIQVIKYLYGSMTLGMDLLDGCRLDTSFTDSLLEICRVCLGSTSSRLKASDINYVREFMQDRDTNNLIRFAAEVSALNFPRRRQVISAFMRCHPAYNSIGAPSVKPDAVIKSADTSTIAEETHTSGIIKPISSLRTKSLDELFGGGEKFE